MSQIPPPLDYRAPQSHETPPLRKKASRQARGNGTGCIVLGLCIGAATSSLVARLSAIRGPAPITIAYVLVMLLLAVYTLMYLVCGVIYLIASFKIKQPNETWERILTITAACHICVVMAMLVVSVLMNGATSNISPVTILGFVINLAIIISLAQSIQSVRKARTEAF